MQQTQFIKVVESFQTWRIEEEEWISPGDELLLEKHIPDDPKTTKRWENIMR
jgi:hypothetical protein